MKKPSLNILLALLAIIAIALAARTDEKAVRKELMVIYGKIAKAMQAKDLKASLAPMTPDYSEKSLAGTTVKRPQIDREREQSFASARSLQASFHIIKLSLARDTAVATVRYTLSMMTQPALDPQGKVHKIVAIAPFKHTWIKTAKG